MHSLGNYGFVLGLFALGLGAWQIMVSLGVGAVLILGLLTLSGYMGYRTGVPFPVMSRIAFGVRGAQIPALLRGVVAIVWFGIQTYLATNVLTVLVVALAPGAAALERTEFLGLSALGWICFLALWVVQVGILLYGMDGIRRYEAVAGPIVLVALVALAVWTFLRAGGSIALSVPEPLTGGAMWVQILGGATRGSRSTARSCSTSATSPAGRAPSGRSVAATCGESWSTRCSSAPSRSCWPVARCG